MNAHTPGPWLHGKASDDIITPTGVGIASPCDGYDEEQWKADARLIASAPDLLKVLRECEEFVDNYVDVVDGSDGPRPNSAMSMQQQIREAIAKAEGRAA